MTNEQKLANLIAHPVLSGDKVIEYHGHVMQLAAVCDLHRRTLLSEAIMRYNSFRCICRHIYQIQEHSRVCFDKDGTWLFCDDEHDGEYQFVRVCTIRSVADLESILDLLGIDKKVNLPPPPKQISKRPN